MPLAAELGLHFDGLASRPATRRWWASATETEREIQEALERLIAGRTVFAIAHRLSTQRRASRLFVIADGRLPRVAGMDGPQPEAAVGVRRLRRVDRTT